MGLSVPGAPAIGGEGLYVPIPAVLNPGLPSSLAVSAYDGAGTLEVSPTGLTPGSTRSISPNDGRLILDSNGNILRGLTSASAGVVAYTYTESGLGLSSVARAIAVTFGSSPSAAFTSSDAATYVLAPTAVPAFSAQVPTGQLVDVDTSQQFQTWTGAGAALTEATCYTLLTRFTAAQRAAFLQEVYGENGFNTARICMGTSDFSEQAMYTYDDVVGDYSLANFSIAKDQTYVIPILLQVLAINPNIKFIAAPWSPPAWLKSGSSPTIGGGSGVTNTFNATAQNMTTYAQYFVNFIQAYAALGIAVSYVTPQNEPSENTAYPSCQWQPADLVTFVGSYLGPAFAAANITTKILGNDDSWGADKTNGFSAALLANSTSASYLDGFAFHAYSGYPYEQISDLSENTTKSVHMTEYCIDKNTFTTSAMDMNNVATNLMVGSAHYRGSSITLWNLILATGDTPVNTASSSRFRATCNVSTDGQGTITRNPEYDALCQITRNVRPGAVRVGCASADIGYNSGVDLQTNAWLNPDGSIALFMFNPTAFNKNVSVRDVQSDTITNLTVTAGSMETLKYGGLPARTLPTTDTAWTPQVLINKYGAANVFFADPTVAANLTQSGGLASQVLNTGGYGGSLTATGSAEPKVETINGVTFLGFDGAQALSQASMTHPAGPISFCTIARYTSSRLNSCVYPSLFGVKWSSTAGFGGPQINVAANGAGITNQVEMGAGGYTVLSSGQLPAPASLLVDTVKITDGNFHVISGQLGSLNTNLKVDGVLADAQYNLTGTFAAFAGALSYGSNNPSSNGWAGNLGPMIIVRAAITPEEQEQLEGWCAWHTGQQATLNAGSPYAAAQPYMALGLSGTLPSGYQGVAYSWSPTISGGVAPFTFTLNGGPLPSGLSFNASTGAISGTPSALANLTGLTISGVDADGYAFPTLSPGTLSIVAATGAYNALTLSSTTPTPLLAFAPTISGQTSGSTLTFSSSDGTTWASGGSAIYGSAASGTTPTLSVTESGLSGYPPKTTTISLHCHTLMTPATIPSAPTLLSWLKASTGLTLSGSSVTAVADEGTIAGSYAPGSAPTLNSSVTAFAGQSGIVFNGTSSYLVGNTAEKAITESLPGLSESVVMTLNSIPAANGTIATQCIATSTSNRAGILVNTSGAPFTTSRTTDAGTATSLTGTALTVGVPTSVLAEINLPAGTAEIRQNGVQTITGAITQGSAFPATASNAVAIGAGGAGGGPAPVTLAEFRLYGGILTTTQKQELEGCDAWLYGYQARLPTSHPYYAAPPLTS